MRKRDLEFLDHLADPAMDALIAEVAPPKQKRTPMTVEAREKMRIASELGIDPHANKRHYPGRPQGSKNKPKPAWKPGDPVRVATPHDRQRKPRLAPWSLATCHATFTMLGGEIRPINKDGKISTVRKSRRVHGTKDGQIRYAEQPTFKYGEQWLPAADIAFMLLFKLDVPDGLRVASDDKRERPVYRIEDLYFIGAVPRGQSYREEFKGRCLDWLERGEDGEWRYI